MAYHASVVEINKYNVTTVGRLVKGFGLLFEEAMLAQHTFHGCHFAWFIFRP